MEAPFPSNNPLTSPIQAPRRPGAPDPERGGQERRRSPRTAAPWGLKGASGVFGRLSPMGGACGHDHDLDIWFSSEWNSVCVYTYIYIYASVHLDDHPTIASVVIESRRDRSSFGTRHPADGKPPDESHLRHSSSVSTGSSTFELDTSGLPCMVAEPHLV